MIYSIKSLFLTIEISIKLGLSKTIDLVKSLFLALEIFVISLK